MRAFIDQGADLSDVDTIAIGLGAKGNTRTPGGSGKMYFDDIRLYLYRNTAEEQTPLRPEWQLGSQRGNCGKKQKIYKSRSVSGSCQANGLPARPDLDGLACPSNPRVF